jgi:Rrf2 family protein
MNTSSKFVVATHILTMLAGRKMIFGEEDDLNSEQISHSVNTNPVVIRRLLSKLNEKGLVYSKPGPHGGSHLAKDPGQIKLSEIYDAVEEGQLFHLHYSQPNPICPVGNHIQDSLTQILCRAEEAFRTILETKTLMDISQEVMNKSERLKNKSTEEIRQLWNATLQQMQLEHQQKL